MAMSRLPALVAVALIACGSPEEPVQGDDRPRVATEAAGQPPGHVDRVLFGVLAPRRDATLSARVPGVVVERLVEPGDPVAEGAPLLRLDAREARANLAAAEAAVTDARAALDEARRRLERLESLGDGAAEAELDQARTALQRAEAGLQRAEAQRDLASVQRSHHTLRAPFAGEVASLIPDPGELIGAGTQVARVVDTAAFEVVVGLLGPEVAAARSPDSRFLVVVDGREVPATVHRIPAAADPATLDWKVELQVPPGEGLYAGAPVEVRAHLVAPPASARIDRRSVQDGAVWVVEGDTVRRQPVQVVREVAADVLVRGLEPGQRVVVRRPRSLSEGDPVVVLGED